MHSTVSQEPTIEGQNLPTQKASLAMDSVQLKTVNAQKTQEETLTFHLAD